MVRILPALRKTQDNKKNGMLKKQNVGFQKTYMKGMDIIKKNMTS